MGLEDKSKLELIQEIQHLQKRLHKLENSELDLFSESQEPEKSEYFHFLSRIHAAVITLDNQGKIVEWDEDAEKLFGFSSHVRNKSFHNTILLKKHHKDF